MLVLILSGFGYAAIYKYKDENGVWRFTDVPVTEEQAAERIGKSSNAAMPASRNLAQQLLEKKKPKNNIEKATMATVGIQTPAGFGSGFFVTGDGYIITNKHVLKGSEQEIRETENDYRDAEAEIKKAEQFIQEKEAEIADAELKLEIFKASLGEAEDHNVRWAGEEKYHILRYEIEKWKGEVNRARNKLADLKKSLNESEEEFHFNVNNADIGQSFYNFSGGQLGALCKPC